MRIETKRLVITDFTPDMAEALHLGSLDEDTRRFVPDEVFDSVEAAAEIIGFLTSCYGGTEGPFVHPMLAAGRFVGYVQLCPLDGGEWEIGYHTVRAAAGQGYATEAVCAFLPVMMDRLGLTQVAGICLAENLASLRVLEKCGFRRVFEGNALYQGDMRPIVKMMYTK